MTEFLFARVGEGFAAGSNIPGFVTWTLSAAPATPAAGFLNLYADSGNKVMTAIDQTGRVSVMANPSAAVGGQYVSGMDAAGNLTRAALPSGTPGGSNGQVQYNNAGAFGGMSGTSWDNTNLALTITGATVTTSNPILNLTQTWNAGGVAFNGILLNITNTASAAGARLINLQVGGSTKFAVDVNGAITGANFTSGAQGLVPASGGGTTNFLRADGIFAGPAVTNTTADLTFQHANMNGAI